MKTRIFAIATILILGILIFSYVTYNAQGTESVDVNAVRTQAVETYAASLTGEPVATETEYSTLTVEPATSTPTADVTATLETPQAANPCYKLLWIEDRSIPDGKQMKPGEAFTKTWLVQNNGGCAWAPGFSFQHVGGNTMGGKPLALKEAIPAGAKREISIDMVVPNDQTGLIQSSWRMSDENGIFFGDTLSVNITVGSTATPSATPVP
jgi:hypothetical protein